MKTKPALLLAVLIGYAAAMALRWDGMHERTGGQGLEASYHAILTMNALATTPANAHLYLPTLTLAPDPDHPVQWGKRSATAGGSFIYTSFPPLGFILPLAALRLVSAPLDFLSLAWFNSLIGLVAAVGIGALCRAATTEALRPARQTEEFGALVFGCAAVMYLLLRESLVSHGAVYWPQSISQICLIFAALLAFGMFQGKGQRGRIVMLTLCLIYPLLEWTGYIFNIGLALAFHLAVSRRAQDMDAAQIKALKRLPVVFAAITTFAGVATLAHFSYGIGISETIESLGSRAATRAGGGGSLLGLPTGYLLSMAGLVPVCALALGWAVAKGKLRGNGAVGLLLLVTAFPMIENLILSQHAEEFSFDRLKVAVPLLVLLCVICARAAVGRRTAALVLASVVTVASNVAVFRHDSASYRIWGETVAHNAGLAESLRQDPLAQCSLYGARGEVRGYLNMLFARDIYQTIGPKSLAKRRTGHCGLVLIDEAEVFTDLPRVKSITIYDADGVLVRRLGDPAKIMTKRP